MILIDSMMTWFLGNQHAFKNFETRSKVSMLKSFELFKPSVNDRQWPANFIRRSKIHRQIQLVKEIRFKKFKFVPTFYLYVNFKFSVDLFVTFDCSFNCYNDVVFR